MKKLVITIVVAMMLSASLAHATLIEITGTSASAGYLGEFVLDSSLVTTGFTPLHASDFETFYFKDPFGSAVFDPTTVTHDTGVTYFGFFGPAATDITVLGGGGDSLTLDSGLGRVWIAGTNFVIDGSSEFYDVSWSTTPYSAPVPEPSTFILLGAGLAGVGFLRRRAQK